jgi:hypothetical protein
MWAVAITIVAIIIGGYLMSAALDRLKAEIAENKTVTQSVLTLVQSISGQLRELSEKVAAGEAAEAEIAALADELDASTNQLASAVTANTPVADEPAPETPTTETPSEDTTGGETATETDTGGEDSTGTDETKSS